MEISEDLRCVFSAEVERKDGSYVIEVPERELRLNSLEEGDVYRIAVLARHGATASSETEQSPAADQRVATRSELADEATEAPSASDSTDTANGSPARSAPPASNGEGATDQESNAGVETGEPEPPVDRGDEVTVDIEGIGDQGDGIARVDRGYVIIVPDTEKGERVRIRVTSVKQNVAFAEVIERIERHQYE